jgi:hypothetical protein
MSSKRTYCMAAYSGLILSLTECSGGYERWCIRRHPLSDFGTKPSGDAMNGMDGWAGRTRPMERSDWICALMVSGEEVAEERLSERISRSGPSWPVNAPCLSIPTSNRGRSPGYSVRCSAQALGCNGEGECRKCVPVDGSKTVNRGFVFGRGPKQVAY